MRMRIGNKEAVAGISNTHTGTRAQHPLTQAAGIMEMETFIGGGSL